MGTITQLQDVLNFPEQTVARLSAAEARGVAVLNANRDLPVGKGGVDEQARRDVGTDVVAVRLLGC